MGCFLLVLVVGREGCDGGQNVAHSEVTGGQMEQDNVLLIPVTRAVQRIAVLCGAVQDCASYVVECSALYMVQCTVYCEVQCSAVNCSIVKCSAVPCSAVQCSAVQCNAIQCSAVQCSAV